ncbi:hypothetical protein EJ08DRAFT_659249 [Tothia fuscella]|uniref:Uncharacterized protein n=1 Tax=Tothia fuscella TaxID=1048955 RepID=A0A9P4NV83_9PEZI|nr:hypothetical protein EJ08DRAFT_659249 [Tothia fuscella]
MILLPYLLAILPFALADNTTTTTFALWAPKAPPGHNNEGILTDYYGTVLDCDTTAATLQINCRPDVAPSKCIGLSGQITHGPSVHNFMANNTNRITSLGCSKTADNANFLCTITTGGEVAAKTFTVGAGQISSFPLVVTGGGERLRTLVTGAPVAVSGGKRIGGGGRVWVGLVVVAVSLAKIT